MAVAGHRKNAAAARRGLAHADGRVRELALGALARAGALDEPSVVAALEDPVPAVRRRAADLAARLPPSGELHVALRRALADADPLVVEAACWSIGEQGDREAVATLSGTARLHVDARAREAALAALAAIGDPAGLEAVLDALSDRPTVRRRAVVALAAFDGPEVDEAIRRSAADRDWQVREVAEILLDEGQEGEPPGG
jgi:HEAT repeat protein